MRESSPSPVAQVSSSAKAAPSARCLTQRSSQFPTGHRSAKASHHSAPRRAPATSELASPPTSSADQSSQSKPFAPSSAPRQQQRRSAAKEQTRVACAKSFALAYRSLSLSQKKGGIAARNAASELAAISRS